MMIAILFAYLFLIAILNYMGYISYIPFVIPLFIAIIVWIRDAKEIDNKPLAFILGISVAGMYYYGYEFLFASKSTGVFTYIFTAFVAFLLAIYVMGIKRFGREALEMGIVFFIFVTLLALLSPIFLGMNRWATQDTKISMLASMKEAFDEVYHTQADSFSSYVKNIVGALNPNTYIATTSSPYGSKRGIEGLIYNPEDNIKKEKDESFIAHLSTAKSSAVFLPYLSPGWEEEGLENIRFTVKNEKDNVGIFRYTVGYIIGTKLFSSGLQCKDNKPYCLTQEGDILKGGESKEEEITLKIPECNGKGDIYFYKKYISLTQSRKKVDLEEKTDKEKTLVSNDPVNLIINDIITQKGSEKEITISITPYVSKNNGWKRKGYIPYILINIPAWLEPTKHCDWNKKVDKRDGSAIYSIDLTNNLLCLKEGEIGNTYSCKFRIKEDLGIEYFDVYAVAPYLIKEYIGPQVTTIRSTSSISCSITDSESVKDAIKKIEEHFEFDEDNIRKSEYFLSIRGAMLKSNIKDAIKDLATYCAQLNAYNPAGMKCFSIEFRLPPQSKEEIKISNEESKITLNTNNIKREEINILKGEIEREALTTIAMGAFKNKANIKFTPDSKDKLTPGSKYVMDIYFTSGCNYGTVWVKIYD